jgi:DUF4097 and DUF4098 domain-containing protein YvlB
MRSRRVLVLMALAGVPSVIFAQENDRQMTCDEGRQGDRASHCEINEMSIPVVSRLAVDGGVNGGISVKGWSKSEMLIRARVETAAQTDARAQALARQVVIHTGGGRIMAYGPQQDNHENWSVTYEIFVPKEIDLNLKAHNGGIRISDVRGHIEFDALNGGVSLKRLAGDVRGHTINGGLSVELSGNRWEGGQLDATTTNGGVAMVVPANYSAHIETSTVNGHINVDFPATVRGEIDRQLSMDLGAGGPLVRAVTTNGGVSIKRKTT